MPSHPLVMFLEAVHEALSFLTDDARLIVDQVIATLVTDAVNLRLPVAEPLLPRVISAPAYFQTNIAQEVIEVSAALLALLEIPDASTLVGYEWHRYLEPTEERRRLERWMVAAQDHKAFAHRSLIRTASGRHLTVQEWVLPVHNAKDGQTFEGWIAIVQPVAKVIHIDARRLTIRLSRDTEQSA